MKVYKDTKSGLWMQEGGSRYGFSDEIDSYLVGEAPMQRSIRRNAIGQCIVPDDLLVHLPPQEMRGLDFLLDVLTCAKDLRVSNRGTGRILARLNPEVDVEILAETMIRNRLGVHPGWTSNLRPLPSFDPHLLCYLQDACRYRNLEDGMILCIRAPHQDDRSEFSASINGTESVTWDNRSTLPVTDIIASWVMWADCGFPNPPQSFTSAYSEFTGYLLPEIQTAQFNSRNEDEFDMFEDLDEFLRFDEAWSWEFSLERRNESRSNARKTCNKQSRRRKDG